MTENDLLAFVHIEKAAGTTFIHILRKNFLFHYLDARPFSDASNGIFTANDFKLSNRLSPGLACIAGHSVKPYSDLYSVTKNLKYITILRNPFKRYLSQYQYGQERMNKNRTFEEFLNIERLQNFQTKKYSSSGNLEEAKEVLANKIFLLGFVEEFDEFLVLLRHYLKPMEFDPFYQRKNLARNKVPIDDLAEQFHDRITENNQLDQQLYDFAKEEIYPTYIKQYGNHFADDVAEFKQLNNNAPSSTFKQHLDYILRKAYLYPATSLLRLANGRPASGSY